MLLNLDYLRNKKILKYDNHKIVIKWDNKSIHALDEIMNIIMKSKLMELFGYIVQTYIEMHEYFKNFNDYTLDTVEKQKNINENILMLGYVCELYISKNKKNKKYMTKNLVYFSFGKILYEIISNIFLYNIPRLQYTETYIVRLVNEIIVKTPNIHTQQMVISAYFLTKYLISNNNMFSLMNILMLRTEELDITILTPKQSRDIMNTLGTKRTLYLRIFLVLSEHRIREKFMIANVWYKVKFNIRNKNDLCLLLEDVIIEIIICLVANYIIYEDNTEESFSGE